MFPTSSCIFSSYWVPPVLVHSHGEIPETAKHRLDILTCYDVFNNRDAGDPADTKLVVSPHSLERGSSVLQTGAIVLQTGALTVSRLLYTCRTHELGTEAKSMPEFNYLFCSHEIVVNKSTLKYVGTQGYSQSIYWVLPNISVLQLGEDDHQWPWDPRGIFQ